MKSPEQEAREYADDECYLEGTPVWRDKYEAHLAGQESMKARILEMLRSEDRSGALNDTGWMHADWLESVLKEEKK